MHPGDALISMQPHKVTSKLPPWAKLDKYQLGPEQNCFLTFSSPHTFISAASAAQCTPVRPVPAAG